MSLTHRQRLYLQAMEIPIWESRADKAPGQDAAVAAPIASLDWPALRAQVAGCQVCSLHKTRTQTVFGVGDVNAQLMIIGAAPGEDEDLQGEPFVGRAGQLLNEMLFAMGLKREQIYIANILKCRPPNDRDPLVEEAAKCKPYLLRQIEWVQPRLILAVGRVAAQNLLQSDVAIGELRGKVHDLPGAKVPLVATYHPADLLRSPLEKRKVWNDLRLVMQCMRTMAQA